MAISNTQRYSVVKKFLFCFTLLFLLGSQMAYSDEPEGSASRLLDLLLKRLGEDIITVSDDDIKKEIGNNRLKALSADQRPLVELILKSSVERPIAGEPWTIFATISNRSSFPVWIVDAATMLNFTPELTGRSNKSGSRAAFFPTIPSRNENEIIRIEPNSNYIATFKIDPVTFTKRDNISSKTFWKLHDFIESTLGFGEDISNTITQFSFFTPGIYEMSSIVHIWVKPPVVKNGKVVNYGDTVTITSSISKQVDSSPWVLIMGASIGGILYFFLGQFYQNGNEQPQQNNQIVSNSEENTPNPIMKMLIPHPIGHFIVLQTIEGIKTGSKWIFNVFNFLVMKLFFKGVVPSVLLTGVGTILLSRLSTTNFLLAVKITDIWGAIVVGFMLQWGGYTLLSKMMTQAMAKTDNKQVGN
jgi:hypothetical protein